MNLETMKLEDFTLHCRSCLVKITDIKHSVTEMESPMLQLFLHLTGYKKTQAYYPDGICDHCFVLLKSFLKFQEMSLKSKAFLEKALNAFSEEIKQLKKIEKNRCLTAKNALKTEDSILELESEFNSVDPSNEQTINDTLPTNKKGTKKKYEIIEEIVESSKEFLIDCKEEKEIVATTKSEDENASEKLISTYLNKKKTCTICSRELSSTSSLTKHMRIHQNERPFKCTNDQCNAAFNFRHILKKHMETHADVPLQFSCKFGCGQIFDRSQKAQNHYRKHHSTELNNSKTKRNENLSFICEDCGKVSKNLRNFKEHRIRHLPNEERPFHCEICDKRFGSQTDLNDHIMRHNGIKKFQCPHCDVKTVTSRELRLHVSNIHTKEMRVDCDVCKRTFVNSGCLKRHIKVVHQGIKSYQCKYCDKAFGASEHLKHHLRTHTGEKPHKCNKCDRSFIQPTALRVHMKTHERRNF